MIPLESVPASSTFTELGVDVVLTGGVGFGISSSLGSLSAGDMESCLDLLDTIGAQYVSVGCTWPWIDRAYSGLTKTEVDSEAILTATGTSGFVASGATCTSAIVHYTCDAGSADVLNAFDYDFSFKTAGGAPLIHAGYFTVSATSGVYSGLGSGDIYFGMGQLGGPGYLARLGVVSGGSELSTCGTVGVLTFASTYYATIRRATDAGTVYCDIYSDAARTTLLQTLSASGCAGSNYRYVQPLVVRQPSAPNSPMTVSLTIGFETVDVSVWRDWSVSDAFAAACTAHSKTIVGSLNGYAAWANAGSGDYYVPTSLSGWSAFVTAAVTRYPQIGYWEVWNEPNNDDFWTRGHAAASAGVGLYAAMLKRARTAIKAAHPDAVVIGGAIDRNDVGYLNDLYRELKLLGGTTANKHYFDLLSVHPYCSDSAGSWTPNPNPARAPEDTDAGYVTSTMDRNFAGLYKMAQIVEDNDGPTKHLCVTEFGWRTTGGPSVSEAVQSDYLQRAYAMARDWPWMDWMLWYGFKNWDNSELPWSLVNSNLSAKESYTGYHTAADVVDTYIKEA